MAHLPEQRRSDLGASDTTVTYVPYDDFVLYTVMAAEIHAIIFWHIWDDGSYQPLMLPVDEDTWRQILQ